MENSARVVRRPGLCVEGQWLCTVLSVSTVRAGKVYALERQKGSGPWPSFHLPPLSLLCSSGEGQGYNVASHCSR